MDEAEVNPYGVCAVVSAVMIELGAGIRSDGDFWLNSYAVTHARFAFLTVRLGFCQMNCP